MDAGDWIAGAAAVVALAGAAVAVWQASSARDSARASKRQAEAAEIQAQAALRQVTLAEVRHQQDSAPQSAGQGKWFFDGERFVEAAVSMTSGPVLPVLKGSKETRWSASRRRLLMASGSRG